MLAQLVAIACKGKAIPSVAALVEAMFMAEVKNGLLTAGHDLDRLQLPVTAGVAGGMERYTLLRGQVQECKAGDKHHRYLAQAEAHFQARFLKDDEGDSSEFTQPLHPFSDVVI